MKYIKNGLNFAETVFTISQMLFKIKGKLNLEWIYDDIDFQQQKYFL